MPLLTLDIPNDDYIKETNASNITLEDLIEERFNDTNSRVVNFIREINLDVSNREQKDKDFFINRFREISQNCKNKFIFSDRPLIF